MCKWGRQWNSTIARANVACRRTTLLAPLVATALAIDFRTGTWKLSRSRIT